KHRSGCDGLSNWAGSVGVGVLLALWFRRKPKHVDAELQDREYREPPITGIGDRLGRRGI
ncbi:MAG: hypothetical protein DWQ20_02775, partial [Actinobacteria bacterium]